MPPSRPRADTVEYQNLVLAQAAIRAKLTEQSIAMATNGVRGFKHWYDTDAITEWADKLTSRIETLQRSMARSMDTYLARSATMLTGRRVRPVGAVDVGSLRTGITHAGAYARAADTYRWQQSQFDGFAKALLTGTDAPAPRLIDPVQAAADRAAAAADMDSQLIVRHQTLAFMSDAADRGVITGYRRVIHPEQSKGGTCGLCVAASDRLYGPHEPLPIHARCECTTLPVRDGLDPGSTLNTADLGKLYGDANSTHGHALKRTRYQIDKHGELGLVLAPKGAKVRTERQATRDTNRIPRRAQTDAEKRAKVEQLHEQLALALPAVRAKAQTAPDEWGHYLTSLEARISSLEHQLAA